MIDQAHIPGKLAWLDKVTRTYLCTVQVQFPCDSIHDTFHYKDRVRPSCSTVGADRNLVGVENSKLAVVVLQAIRTRQSAGSDNGHDDAIGRIGSGIMQKFIAYSQQYALIIKGIFYFVLLAALLVGGDEMFAPVLDPFDRPPQLDSREWRQNLLWIEHHDLGEPYVRVA